VSFTDDDQAEEYDKTLQATRDLFANWRIIETDGGGFAAVPKDTEIISAATLDGLVAKLSQRPG
jgi:hypothetical protein